MFCRMGDIKLMTFGGGETETVITEYNGNN